MNIHPRSLPAKFFLKKRFPLSGFRLNLGARITLSIGLLIGLLSLVVFVQKEQVESILAQNGWQLIFSVATIVTLLMGSLYLLVRRLIVTPIGQLKAVAVSVGEGDYQARCHLNSGDELEALGEAINQMMIHIQGSCNKFEDQVAQRTNELGALSEIAFTLSCRQPLPEALNRALETIFKVTPADGGAIHLLAEVEDKPEMKLMVWRGLLPAQEKWMKHLKLGQCIPGQVAQAGTSIYQVDGATCDQNSGCRSDCPLLHQREWKVISAPLKFESQMIGIVTLLTRQPEGFSNETVQLLECVGHQLGVGVENARFRRQMGQMTVLKERTRLACELHDNLAQTIGYLNLSTQLISNMVQVGQYDDALKALSDMHQSTSTAYDDVRWAIFDLRAPADCEQNFGEALHEYVDEFEVQTGLRCHLIVNGETDLLPNVKIQLMRIIQESMHNIRKHAKARNIWLKFEQNSSGTQLSVEDDGVGIDNNFSRRSSRRFGLCSMRERAKSINWQLEIGKGLESGTKVVAQQAHHKSPTLNA